MVDLTRVAGHATIIVSGVTMNSRRSNRAVKVNASAIRSGGRRAGDRVDTNDRISTGQIAGGYTVLEVDPDAPSDFITPCGRYADAVECGMHHDGVGQILFLRA